MAIESKISVEKSERNHGIDLLRIISMIMIVTLHVLGQGGISDVIEDNSLKFAIVWLLEMICLCSVNCYGLISGYVGYGRNFKFSNVIYLWIEVVFYNFIFNLLSFLSYKFGLTTVFYGDFYEILFPLKKSLYWYFTAYFFMSFFIPLFNVIIQRLDKKILTYAMLTLIVSICLFYTIFYFPISDNVFLISNGYSIVWLSTLYFIGAYVKKYNFLRDIRMCKYIVIFIFNCFLLLGLKFLETNNMIVPGIHYAVMSYANIFSLIDGVLLLSCFSRLKLNKLTIYFVNFFFPVTFGVYIIHLQQYVWNHILMNRFLFCTEYNSGTMLILILLSALGIWLVCSLIDRIRMKIFDIFKVKKHCEKLEKWGRNIFNKIYDKYFSETMQ